MAGTDDGLTLAGLLRADGLGYSHRRYLSLALSAPWCWPADPELAALAERRGHERPGAPATGETCLVSASEGVARLRRLVPAGRARAQARPFVRRARQTARRAWLLTSRDLPVLRTLTPLEAAPQWRAEPVAELGDGPADHVLDGRSYGLALVLTGRPDAALTWLAPDRADWGDVHGHVQCARRRWRALALDDLGRRDEAATERRTLEDEVAHLDTPDLNLHLARLDVTLAASGNPAPHLAGLASSGSPEASRLLADGRLDEAAARRVVVEWRY